MSTPVNRHIIASFTVAVALAGACGEEDHHEHATTAEDACEHILEQGTAITAIDDTTADAPDVADHHRRFDIALVGEAGSLGGYVDLVSDEAAEVTVFLSADVPITLYDSAGDEVSAESSDSVDECAELDNGYTYDLGVGTYLMSFGPTSEDSVSIVVIEEGDHEHE